MFRVYISRGSCPELFCKKVVLENFAKFTGKHPCQSVFFGVSFFRRPATLLKRDRCFPRSFAKFLRTPSPTEHHR